MKLLFTHSLRGIIAPAPEAAVSSSTGLQSWEVFVFKRKRTWIILALVAVVAFAGWSASQPEPVNVVVGTAEIGLVEATVTNTRAGTVNACRRAGLAPQIGGLIAALPVKEGDQVVAGQLLLKLWNADLQAEVVFSERGADSARLLADQACVIADVAEKEARRITRLHAKGLASEEARDRAVGEQRSSAAACAASQSQVSVAMARLAVSRATLERTVLHAPFDGTVAEINGELGEFVTPSPVGIPTPPAVDLIDTSCLYIKAPIDEVDAPAIVEGMPARISMDAFPDRFFPGVVRRLAPYVLDLEKQARTVDIEAEIDNPEAVRNLLPGYSADVEVILATRSDVLRIPTQSVLEGNRVLVLAGGLLSERDIEVGVTNWEHTEVVSGLAAGDQVVVSVDRRGVEPGALAQAEEPD
jgi:HlyD family secretion protein